MADAVQEYLPLTETTFYVLLSIAAEPRHGYAILKDVQSLSRGRLVLSTGTLYGALCRLLDQGLIQRVEEQDREETGRPRKLYSLSERGRAVLAAEIERLHALIGAAQRRWVPSEG
jgi:DNA-binding PadR family transcriptional regulator